MSRHPWPIKIWNYKGKKNAEPSFYFAIFSIFFFFFAWKMLNFYPQCSFNCESTIVKQTWKDIPKWYKFLWHLHRVCAWLCGPTNGFRAPELPVCLSPYLIRFGTISPLSSWSWSPTEAQRSQWGGGGCAGLCQDELRQRRAKKRTRNTEGLFMWNISAAR